MVRTLAQHWWVLLLRGLLAIAFGVFTYVQPLASIAALVLLWGAYMLVDGVFELVAGVRAKWGSLILLGILGIAAGLVALVLPAVAAVALLWIIAFWAIVAGIMQISAAVRLRKEVEGEWLWILSGICTVVLGALLIARPGAGALSLVWLIASFAIVWGILLVILAFKLKGHAGRLVARAA
jgi:uncharacterized membrane protein HdeD (DUF308 family)